MGKIKTRGAVAKRFKITKTGKVKKITCGQDHFNARESGNTKRNKRRLETGRKSLVTMVKNNIK